MEKYEKRQSTRIPVTVYLEASGETYPLGVLKEVSRRGLFIQSTEIKEPGTRLDLSIRLPEGEDSIQLTAEVIWVIYPPVLQQGEGTGPARKPVTDNPGMGLRVLSASSRDRDLLDRLLVESVTAATC